MNTQPVITQSKDEPIHIIDAVITTTPKKSYSLAGHFQFFQNSSHLINHDKENSFLKSNSRLHLAAYDQMNDQHFGENYAINSGNVHLSNQIYTNDLFSSYPFSSVAGFQQYPQQISQGNNSAFHSIYYGIESGYGQKNYPSYAYGNSALQNTGGNSCFFYNNKTPLTGQKITQNIILQKSEQRLQNGLGLLVDTRYPGNQVQPADQQQNGLGILGEEQFGNGKKEVTDFSLSALAGKVSFSEFGAAPSDGLIGQQNSQLVSAFSLVTAPSMNPSTFNQNKSVSDAQNRIKLTPQKRIVKSKSKSFKISHNNSASSNIEQIQQQPIFQANLNSNTYPHSQSSFENNQNIINQPFNMEQLRKNSISSSQIKDTIQIGDTLRGFVPSAKRSAQKKQGFKKASQRYQQHNLSARHLQQEQDHNLHLPILKLSSDMPFSSTQEVLPSCDIIPQETNAQLSLVQGISLTYLNPQGNKELEEDQNMSEEKLFYDEEEDDNDDDDDLDNIECDEEPTRAAGLIQNKNIQKSLPRSKSSRRSQKILRIHQNEGDDSGQEKRGGEPKPCNCRNSKCLKRYCDCFAAGIYCSVECKCEECHNKPEYEEERQKAILKKKKRIKDAFLPVIINNSHIKGCHCKHSHCQKKYCVCHQNGVLCSSLCQCLECDNKIAEINKQQQDMQLFDQNQNPQLSYQHLQQQYVPQQQSQSQFHHFHDPQKQQHQQIYQDSNEQFQQNQSIPSLPPLSSFNKYQTTSIYPENEDNLGDLIEFPSTIKKSGSNQLKQISYDEDFSTHKKPSKRRAYKTADQQKALQFFNEISPADNKYITTPH